MFDHRDRRFLAALLVTSTLAGVACRPETDGGTGGTPPLATLDSIDVGAAPGSTWPNLATDGQGHVVLSWLEARPDSAPAAGPADTAEPEPKYRLRFARHDGSRWSTPGTIADGVDFLLNWADFPAVVPMGDARLAAWWPQQRPAGPDGGYAYDGMVSTSADGGQTWSRGTPIHSDRTPTEHGFLSFVPLGAQGDSIGAVWLDGRDYARPATKADEHRMQIAVATVGANGMPSGERMLDTMACTCCRTSSTRTRRGVLVAYRDRTPGEIRDIAVARYEDGAWAEPKAVHADNWVFPGCPVNGAVLASRGDTVGVAWFTAPNDSARVNLAFSTDGGRTFGPPTRVDDGAPSGRAGIVLDADGSAVVTWLERVTVGQGAENWRTKKGDDRPVGGTALRARRVSLAGARGPAQTLFASTSGRSSGFPQIAAVGDTVYLAWTEPAADGAPSRIQVARTTLVREVARR